MISSELPPTTHTLEMAQVAELNDHLAERGRSQPITAADLGMGGAPLHGGGPDRLAGTAVLVRLSWQGSPEFPDIYGHFGVGRGSAAPVALLHTAALNMLGRQLHLRQCWGVGPAASKQRP